MKIKVTNIVYDTDGESVTDLPNEMIIEISEMVVEVDGIDIESVIADTISDKTGWCIQGYNYEIL
jgi:hypothetical protein